MLCFALVFCVLAFILVRKTKCFSMSYFIVLANPNKTSLSTWNSKTKVADHPPATTFPPASICKDNNNKLFT